MLKLIVKERSLRLMGHLLCMEDQSKLYTSTQPLNL